MGIAVLGPLTIEGEHKVLGRRDRVVLAALAVHPGEVVSAEALADVLWGEQVPPSWAKIVQGCVVRLRKLLGSRAIETSPLGYRLTLPVDDVDAQRFERAVGRARGLLAAGDAERAALVLADALTLWRGRPLTELDGWDPARIEAARLVELRHSAEELYVESALRAGQHDKVLDKAQAFVGEAPLRERRWILLATAQYQAGRQGEALKTIRQLRAVLNRELGLDPSPELDALEQAILRQDPSLVVESALPEPSAACPYPGLKSYDVDDAEVFFGRDADVAACLRRLSDSSVLAVVGPSGCGKSSLVRAGVAAALRRDGVRVVVMTPGVHPVAALAAVMPGTGPPPALLVDQCEEAFSLCQDAAERATFLTTLAAHLTVAPLILSFRADRLADISSHPAFARVVERGLYLLAAMAETDLRAAIEEPARLASLVVEPGLVDLLVGEVADQPGALPLMSHALAETWQRREGRTLTVAGYRATGGIRGAVAQSAEQVYAQVSLEQRTVLRGLLLRLVTPGPEGEPVRSRLPRRLVVTGPENDAMVDLLIGARLVTSDDGVVELAHEALARAWPRLRGWLDDDLEGQRILHHLATVADSWDTLGRPDSELYRGARLANALDWQEGSKPTLTETEQAFLAASKRLSEAELRAAEDTARYQIRVNRRLRTALGTAALLLVGALVAGLVAVGQADRADQEAAAAERAALVADAGRAGAKAVVKDDVDESLLLAVAGIRLHETPESRANLLAVLAKQPRLIRSVETERLDTYAVDVSPDGARVALYDPNGTTLLYDPTTGELKGAHRPKTMPEGSVRREGWAAAAFGPDSRHVAAGMPSPTTHPVRLLDPRTLEPAPESQQLPHFTVPARATHLDYSHDGNSLVAVIKFYANGTLNDYTTGSVLVWNVRQGTQPSVRRTLPLSADAVRARVQISPTGDRVYTTRPLTGYDVGTGKELFSRTDLSSNGIDVTRDGKLLALAGEMPPGSGSGIGDVVLIDAATGAVKGRLPGDDEILTVRFSRDGTRLVSTTAAPKTIVWDVAEGRVVEELEIRDQDLWDVGFSPDDETLYTAGNGALRSWDLSGKRRYLTQVKKPPGLDHGCVIPAPGGRTIYRQGRSGIGFIDVETDQATKPTVLSGDWFAIDSASCGTWHPGGERFAAVKSGVLRVWNTRAGQVIAQRRLPGGPVQDLDYSGRDGSRIAIGQASGMATLLDSDTLKPVGKPVQVGVPIAWLSASPDNRSAVVLTGGRNFGLDFVVPSTGWALLDLEAGTAIRTGPLAMRDPEIATFSPDGRHVAIGSHHGEVMVLDTATGTAVRPPAKLQEDPINSLAYSADGSRLVSSGADGTVTLIDGDTAALFGSVVIPQQTLATADFRPDGRTVVIASYDDGIYHWDTRLEHAIEHACQAAGRDLTSEEWRENFGDRPFHKTCP
ncbi:nSTAND1 domain-containing NTPase [Kribbella caucasensis]|uniref:nSTAND1 domain-containing NTPase n=1 Tax=Kribbella caucasensis TaxID=2512215 RepID=UPI001414DE26|nr:BTAD domain-containing putative transcriptional regulator [Kribbella sp. VKM Ac-2527]